MANVQVFLDILNGKVASAANSVIDLGDKSPSRQVVGTKVEWSVLWALVRNREGFQMPAHDDGTAYAYDGTPLP
jgi:hypothetical protein